MEQLLHRIWVVHLIGIEQLLHRIWVDHLIGIEQLLHRIWVDHLLHWSWVIEFVGQLLQLICDGFVGSLHLGYAKEGKYIAKVSG